MWPTGEVNAVWVGTPKDWTHWYWFPGLITAWYAALASQPSFWIQVGLGAGLVLREGPGGCTRQRAVRRTGAKRTPEGPDPALAGARPRQ